MPMAQRRRPDGPAVDLPIVQVRHDGRRPGLDLAGPVDRDPRQLRRARSKMVPVTIRLTSEDLPTQTFRFEVVHNSMLTPILLGVAVDNVLTTLEKRAGERTIVWKSSIDTPDRTVRWDSVFSGLGAKDDAVASLALLTNFLMANEFRDLPIRGVDVEITHSDRLQSARVVHVEAQKERVRPGETVPVWVDLEDFRGGPRRVVMNARIPADAPPGPMTVFIGDGNAATAYDLSLFPPDPHSLDQVLDFLGRVRPANTRQPDRLPSGRRALVNGEALAGLPPSRAAILHDRGPGDGTPDLAYLRLQSESVEQPVPVAGSARLTPRSAAEDLVRRRRPGVSLRSPSGRRCVPGPLEAAGRQDLGHRHRRRLLARRGARRLRVLQRQPPLSARTLVRVEGITEPVLFAGAAAPKGRRSARGDGRLGSGPSRDGGGEERDQVASFPSRRSPPWRSARTARCTPGPRREERSTAIQNGKVGALLRHQGPVRLGPRVSTDRFSTWARAFRARSTVWRRRARASGSMRRPTPTCARSSSTGRAASGPARPARGLVLRIDKRGRVATVYDSSKTEITSIAGDRGRPGLGRLRVGRRVVLVVGRRADLAAGAALGFARAQGVRDGRRTTTAAEPRPRSPSRFRRRAWRRAGAPRAAATPPRSFSSTATISRARSGRARTRSCSTSRRDADATAFSRGRAPGESSTRSARTPGRWRARSTRSRSRCWRAGTSARTPRRRCTARRADRRPGSTSRR